MHNKQACPIPALGVSGRSFPTSTYQRAIDELPPAFSHQIFVQHPEFEVGQEVRGGKVDRLLVACESHLVLPLALVSAPQATKDFAAGWVQLQQANLKKRHHDTDYMYLL